MSEGANVFPGPKSGFTVRFGALNIQKNNVNVNKVFSFFTHNDRSRISWLPVSAARAERGEDSLLNHFHFSKTFICEIG